MGSHVVLPPPRILFDGRDRSEEDGGQRHVVVAAADIDGVDFGIRDGDVPLALLSSVPSV